MKKSTTQSGRLFCWILKRYFEMKRLFQIEYEKTADNLRKGRKF